MDEIKDVILSYSTVSKTNTFTSHHKSICLFIRHLNYGMIIPIGLV